MQIVRSDAMKNFMGFATSGVSVSIANVATMPMGELLNRCCLALVGKPTQASCYTHFFMFGCRCYKGPNATPSYQNARRHKASWLGE